MNATISRPAQVLGAACSITACGHVVGQYVAGGALYLLTPCCHVLASPAPEGRAVCDGCAAPVHYAHTTGPLTVRALGLVLRELGCGSPLACAATSGWTVQQFTSNHINP